MFGTTRSADLRPKNLFIYDKMSRMFRTKDSVP